MPGYVMEAEPYRPDVILWLENLDGLVVWSEVVDPRQPVSFAASLRSATARPLAGSPRRPDRVRVADPALADELRAAHLGVEIAVAPTPELDAVLASLARATAGDDDESYLEGGKISVEAVSSLFRAAEFLWSIAPWKVADDGQVLRVDVPALDVDGACLSVIGALGQSLGFLLFPSLEAYEVFGETAERNPTGPVDLGTAVLSLNFERGADLPSSLRREIAQHGWPVVSPEAYPVLQHRDRDGLLRPLCERDVLVAAAVATSLASFFVKHGNVLRQKEFEPICESWCDANDLEVRFTAPYEAYSMFEIDELPGHRPERSAQKVGRNAPCPCGSGKKYKKCCLSKNESRSSGRTNVHELDERLVIEMSRYARRRFGEAWLRAGKDFADPKTALQLSVPWSVYGFHVEGRSIVEWFLQSAGRQLHPDERGWLGAQHRAWIGVWEVTAVDPGRSVTVRDLLSAENRQVVEVSGSKTLVLRDTLLGRVVEYEGITVFCGIHPRPLPPLEAAAVVRKARSRLRCKTDVPVERLREEGFGRYLISRWERAVADLDRRREAPAELHNTDGDPLLLTTDHFAFEPERRADVLARLASLANVDLPDEGEEEPCFTVLRPGNRMHKSWDNTVVGRIRVSQAGLRLETNSIGRADDLRRHIESACGDLLCHRAREHSDPVALMKKGGGRTSAPSPIPPPDAGQLLLEYKKRHYTDWVDAPLPALNGKSPREAARTIIGRGQVDVLLKDMENHEARLPATERFDFSLIRAGLGLP